MIRIMAAVFVAALSHDAHASGIDAGAVMVGTQKGSGSGLVVDAACPPAGSIDQEWEESDSSSPARDAAVRHFQMPVAERAPLQVNTHGEYFWIGLSYRNDRMEETRTDPGCFVMGSVAYYYVGHDHNPEFDFVEAVDAGGENRLGARLVEFRWFDKTKGRRMRWFNRALAEKLGWFVDGRGQRQEDTRPIPLPPAVNALW